MNTCKLCEKDTANPNHHWELDNGHLALPAPRPLSGR